VSKSEKAFRTITEVAAILELPAHVLRFWESKFKYIKPMKRGGGRRYYRPEDISLLIGIKHLLYIDGLTIKGAQKSIQTNGVKATIKLGSKNIWYKKTTGPQVDPIISTYDKWNKLPDKNITVPFKAENVNSEKLTLILSALEEIRERIKIRSDKKTVV
jgi:DNA-binding transcriptional MerR regulator